MVFGAPLTEEGIAQISQLIEYLHKSKWHLTAFLVFAMYGGQRSWTDESHFGIAKNLSSF